MGLIHNYPDEVNNRLCRKLGKNRSDVQLHLTQRNGSTLLEAELCCLCAERCLSLALSEEKKDKGGYWAGCTVTTAKKALQKLELTPEPFIELKSCSCKITAEKRNSVCRNRINSLRTEASKLAYSIY